MLKSVLCDCSDGYILVKGRKPIPAGANDAERQTYEINKDVIFKNCAPLTNCKSEINNTEMIKILI